MPMKNKLREKIAESFLGALNEGRIPWKACWQSSPPINAVTGKKYRGINAAMLSYYADEQGFGDSRWCTFAQAKDKGWQVQKGAKGCPIEYWAYFDSFQKKMLPWEEANKLLKDTDYADKYLSLRSRNFVVFNADQIERIPERAELPHTDIGEIRGKRDTLLHNMGLSYREGGSQAYYSPEQDRVTLPPEKSFFDVYSYVGTFLHECSHATGHPSRLDRDLTGDFGSESYAKEELRAEIASAFTAQEIGLSLTDEQLHNHMDLHKAYIQSWATALQDAPEELFRAIKDAEKISDYLIEKGEFEMVREAAQEQKMEEPIGEMTNSYKERMTPRYLVTSYHHFENGFDDKLDYYTLKEAEKAAQGYVSGTMEEDGFKYDGAAVYDQREHKCVRIYGDYPDAKAHAQVYGVAELDAALNMEDTVESREGKSNMKAAPQKELMESFDKIFADIEKERSSMPAAPATRTELQMER